MTAPMADTALMIGMTLAATCYCPRARWYGWALRFSRSTRPNKPAAVRAFFMDFFPVQHAAPRRPLPLPNVPRTASRSPWTADAQTLRRNWSRRRTQSRPNPRSVDRAPWTAARRLWKFLVSLPTRTAHRRAWSRVPPPIKVIRVPRIDDASRAPRTTALCLCCVSRCRFHANNTALKQIAFTG